MQYMTRYDELPTDELLAALETVGRLPDLDLIRACMARPAELTPTLLEWLAGVNDDQFPSEDGRNYRGIHAGLLLISYRELVALPIFAQVLREDEEGGLVEWFFPDLAAYGPEMVPWAMMLVTDESAPQPVREILVELLAHVGWEHPEVREQVIVPLRALLPPLDDDGQPVVPEGYEEADPDEQIWSYVALVLAELHDMASREQIVTLYENDLIDPFLMGDVDAYLKLLASDEGPVGAGSHGTILETYESLWRMDALEAKWAAEEPPATLLPDLPDDLEVAPHLRSDWSGSADSTTYVRSEPKIGRNDPCPCGSGKKYKKCHGKNA